MTQPPVQGDVIECLVAAKVIDGPTARRVRQVARQTSESPIAVLHQLALADDETVAETLCAAFGLARMQPEEAPSAPLSISGLSPAFLERRRIIPLALDEAAVMAAVVDPSDEDGPNTLAFATGYPCERRLLAYSDWRRLFDDLYPPSAPDDDLTIPEARGSLWAQDAARVRDEGEGAPAVRIVNGLLDRALAEGASDIHIEPLPDRVRVRFRVDGELRTVAEEAAHLAEPIAARVKILADMDVADRRTPQDGRTSIGAKGRPVDLRISTVPSAFGETVALRLLRRDAELLDLTRLGFSPPLIDIFEHVLSLRRGLFLITGPTGSGKTTTLYAMLQRLRGEPLKILSVEDPIEYFFPDITQTQVNEEAGVTFATALRSFLRQDPDVILVGEIRDAETARIAIQAALTGHLVLATLHTNDAPGAVARLVDMGVDPYLISDTLVAVVAQRLGRRLCPHCRTPREPLSSDFQLFQRLGIGAAARLHHATGCSQCRGSGLQGRVAIGEGFLVSHAVRAAMANPSAASLAATLRQHGFRSLVDEAAALASRGELSLAEVRGLMVT